MAMAASFVGPALWAAPNSPPPAKAPAIAAAPSVHGSAEPPSHLAPAAAAAALAAGAAGVRRSRRGTRGASGRSSQQRLTECQAADPQALPRRISEGEEQDIAPIPLPLGDVQVDSAMMGYRQFVPRLYNLCKDLGMTPGNILPSIGFCSDENQGYPTILITKHFGTFPFNHGYIGGIMALDRHGPHAAHGEDMVIIHAPHVGYDPSSRRYGVYRRKQVQDFDRQVSTDCGKMAGVLQFYKEEYAKTLGRLKVTVEDGQVLITISNTLLEYGVEGTAIGLRLHFDQMLADPTLNTPHRVRSASRVFVASAPFAARVKAALAEGEWSDRMDETIRALPGAEQRRQWHTLKEPSLRSLLEPEMFSFRKPEASLLGERNRLERELLPHIPMILAGPWDPELTGALTCAQFEFDRSVHSVAQEPSYKGKNVLLVTGLNIDISPDAQDQQAYAFPSTMFLPWAAYVILADGRRQVLEQPEFIKALYSQSEQNPDAIDIEVSITELFSRPRKRVTFYDQSSGQELPAKVL